ncbi:hypothetical protein [Mycobacterium sp. OTB74]|jgi:hypothetical protein|uniref:hypothetical protein n=1 Tax=Mycobacterium sp. OTB74 TaxID=1853452 RepID=UPI002474E0D4|nr:hypothetical protein [Mycobacterium sp. OTB74]MDH6247249.1 hypothetical protein [Mycobacterium sp. OTB74]
MDRTELTRILASLSDSEFAELTSTARGDGEQPTFTTTATDPADRKRDVMASIHDKQLRFSAKVVGVDANGYRKRKQDNN